MALNVPVTWRDLAEQCRLLANALNGSLDGRTNCVGSVTLTESSTTTVVLDARVGADTVITLMPLAADAALSLSTTYVSSRGKGTFTLTHGDNEGGNYNFDYHLSGTGRGT